MSTRREDNFTGKYRIEKNTVQETLVIPLYGRWLCTQRFPGLFQDLAAVEVMEKMDYDFSTLERQAKGLMQTFGALEVAMRQSDLAWEVRDYLKTHPRATVINLGCGLDDTGRRCDNGHCRIYNIDLPDVIEMRDHVLPGGEREQNPALDLKDPAWMKAIDTDPADGTILLAAGVFYYFKTDEVKALIVGMARRFPEGRLVFDAAGRTAVRLMLKTWVKQAGIRNVGAYFSVRDAKREMESWSPLLAVSSRGYMLGYQTLRDPSVRPVHRLLAKIADGPMRLQIVRIDFKEKHCRQIGGEYAD